jgi:hypothetical protein
MIPLTLYKGSSTDSSKIITAQMPVSNVLLYSVKVKAIKDPASSSAVPATDIIVAKRVSTPEVQDDIASESSKFGVNNYSQRDSTGVRPAQGFVDFPVELVDGSGEVKVYKSVLDFGNLINPSRVNIKEGN